MLGIRVRKRGLVATSASAASLAADTLISTGEPWLKAQLSPSRRLWSCKIAAAVSSIERRLTSITGHPFWAKRRRAAATSSFTRSRSM